MLNQDLSRWLIAAAALAIWILICVRFLRNRTFAAAEGGGNLVIYASQTGQARDLAEEAHLRIERSGESSALVEADQVTPALLAGARRLVFVASTTGIGEAPDNARRFEAVTMAAQPDLSGVSASVLALGDRRYTDFCAFGRRIDGWLRECGAEVAYPPVEVDDLAGGDIALWHDRLSEMGFAAAGSEPAVEERRWVIAARERVLGPARDSRGALVSDGLFRVSLEPADGAPAQWEVGDLFELRTPDGHRRDYSIASRAHEGRIDLFVRRVVHDGIVGRGSGWLTDAPQGQANVRGRLRRHATFHAPTGTGPLLAIGAGSGWSGLRPHLEQARLQGSPCRLVFGERASERGSPLLADLRFRQDEGHFEALDIVLSEAAGEGPYVQDLLRAQAGGIAGFLGHDGRIVLCGRLAMGEQCLAALSTILGVRWLDSARADGRLRRDLY